MHGKLITLMFAIIVSGPAWGYTGSPLDFGMDIPSTASQGFPLKCASGYKSLAYDSTNNVLYIGGCGVAKWDGKQFTILASTDNNVNTLAWDSSSNTLYAGGDFNTIAGQSIPYLAKWNGTTWSSVGSGVNGVVWDMFVEPVSHNLYAGGSFATAGGVTVNYVGVWNGTSWSALGSGANGSVYSMAWDPATSSLYVSGLVTTPAARIAKYSSSTWSALGSGLDWYALSLDWDASTNSLYLAGGFTVANGVSCSGQVGKFNGTTFTALGTGFTSPSSIVVGPSGQVFVGTSNVTTKSGTTVNYIAKWDGSAFVAMGNGVNNQIGGYNDLLWVPGTNTLYVVGSFTSANNGMVPAYNLAAWNNVSSTWSSVGSGLDNAVNALAWDPSGKLYVGGAFTNTPTGSAGYVAQWDGTTWSSLGTGVNGAVSSLAWDSNTSSLYAGGAFTTAGGTTVNQVAKWNSGSWSALGATPGVSGANYGVLALAYDAGTSSLYVGGDFTAAGGVASTKGIAKWNGSAWSALGTGAALMFGGVYAAATDSTSALYIGGNFTGAGGVANTGKIAKWSGGAWSSIAATAPNNYVYALVVDPSTNNVYAGGSFTTINGVSANYVAKWNGTAWTALGTGMNGQVKALAWDSATNTLYAGGSFTTAGGTSAMNIAKWNGTTWSALGAGADLPVNALAFQGAQKTLAVGGMFNAVDSVIRPILALFFPLTSTWM